MKQQPDYTAINTFYASRYKQWGYSPKSLGWDKGNQQVRFDVLTSQYSFEQKSILDIGCGFGDLLDTISKKTSQFDYTGIDLSEDFIKKAKYVYTHDTEFHFFPRSNLWYLPEEAAAEIEERVKAINNGECKGSYFVVPKELR